MSLLYPFIIHTHAPIAIRTHHIHTHASTAIIRLVDAAVNANISAGTCMTSAGTPGTCLHPNKYFFVNIITIVRFITQEAQFLNKRKCTLYTDTAHIIVHLWYESKHFSFIRFCGCTPSNWYVFLLYCCTSLLESTTGHMPCFSQGYVWLLKFKR